MLPGGAAQQRRNGRQLFYTLNDIKNSYDGLVV